MHSLLQTSFWAQFKVRHGWQAHQLGDVSFLERPTPFRQRFLYAPELSIETPKDVAGLIGAARELGKARGAFMVRLEFAAGWSDSLAQKLIEFGLIKAFEELQPEFRQWIDLAGAPEAILAHMKPKGRYNIRIAQKHGLTITIDRSVDAFYELFQETARRDGFLIRSRAYFVDLLDTLLANEAGELIVVSNEKQTLAAALITYYDNHAMYLYGASSSINREAMAPYLLHWTAMTRAKDRGCTTYDLLAIAPFESDRRSDLSDQKKTTPISYHRSLIAKYTGLTRFKQQFGGQAVHLLGSWDLVLKPIIYHTFKLAETMRRR